MSNFKKLLLSISALAGLFIVSGCETTHHHESKMPWSKPADWEQRIPGLSM